ncbi:MAG: hypothetical protein ACOYD1_12725 [Candidatus Nanopelagicales bacterium]
MTNSRGFEWRELVYCDFCNPTRRLERTCAGAVVRRPGGERAICAECLRAVQAMGFADLRATECACGEPLRSRHELRAALSIAVEQHLRERSPAAAYALLRTSVLLEQCDDCASACIEANALELATELLERNGGQRES